MAKKKTTEEALTVVEKLDLQVTNIISDEKKKGFEKAYQVAAAMRALKDLLTAEYLEPIMELQGSRLGFRTDKDKDGDGYGLKIVKNCLIEAVLMGVQPVGNQFNIIAGGPYITREGFRFLLKKIPGLQYEVSHELPRVGQTSAAVTSNIFWSLNGSDPQTKVLEFPVRVNEKMGTDAVMGKADRKAYKWLYERLTGNDISDGDVRDLDRLPMPKRQPKTLEEAEEAQQAEAVKRAADFIEACEDAEALQTVEDFAFEQGGELLDQFKKKQKALNAPKK